MKPTFMYGVDALEAYGNGLLTPAELTVGLDYGEETCPICQNLPGTVPSVCHLVPTPNDPTSIFIHYQACDECIARLNSLKSPKAEREARRMVRYFDNWLELEWAPRARRGVA